MFINRSTNEDWWLKKKEYVTNGRILQKKKYCARKVAWTAQKIAGKEI